MATKVKGAVAGALGQVTFLRTDVVGPEVSGELEIKGVEALLTAVGLMLIGVWMRRKAYRLSAIVLLIVTVLKVLAYDTAEVSTPYRILSCLVLGGMLVAVSFLYYRFSERLVGK